MSPRRHFQGLSGDISVGANGSSGSSSGGGGGDGGDGAIGAIAAGLSSNIAHTESESVSATSAAGMGPKLEYSAPGTVSPNVVVGVPLGSLSFETQLMMNLIAD